MEDAVNLKSLWLGKNKIEEITGLSSLTKLEQLDIQSNRLTVIGTGLQPLSLLKELYLAHNGIQTLTDGLPLQSSLHTVDLSSNPITSIAGIESHIRIQELWLTSTHLATYGDLYPLTMLPVLSCVYLEHSPVAVNNIADYRQTLLSLVPTLEQLDADIIER